MIVRNIPQISEMSTPEKILLVEDLWDDIARNESEVPVPDSQRQELDRRIKRHAGHPGNLLSLEELQGRVARNPETVYGSLVNRS